MDTLKALGSGAAGAAALTALHESARRIIPHAPRVDVIGMRAIARPLRAAGRQPPRGRNLFWIAMTCDLVLNSAFYALVGAGEARHPVRRGAALGLAAGLGAALLPPLMGLGSQPHRRTPVTQIMTVCWYLIGGIAAGAVASTMRRRECC